jgi:hypothetical protein
LRTPTKSPVFTGEEKIIFVGFIGLLEKPGLEHVRFLLILAQ